MNRRAFIIGASSVACVGGGIALNARQMGSRTEYDQAISFQRRPIGNPATVLDVIRFATLAANGHNTQPWRFRSEDRTVTILPDLARRTPAVDPDDHHLYVSLGCAAENLALASSAGGFVGELEFDSMGDGSVRYASRVGAKRPSLLSDAIPHRQSTRAEFDGKKASSADLAQLARAAATQGVDVVLMTDRKQIDQVRDLVIAGNDMQMADAAFMAELKSWMRFNPRAALEHGDGLFSASSGNPILPDWLGKKLFDLAFQAKSENEKYVRHIASSSGLVAFVGAGAEPRHWFEVGRSCQRFALQATALGMKLAFINQPVEVARLRPELAGVIGTPGRRPDIVMRFGYGEPLPMSPRRSVDAVVDNVA